MKVLICNAASPDVIAGNTTERYRRPRLQPRWRLGREHRRVEVDAGVAADGGFHAVTRKKRAARRGEPGGSKSGMTVSSIIG